MNRRTQERRQSTNTLASLICACNEAKLRATVDAQEATIKQLEELLAKAGDELVISGNHSGVLEEILFYFDKLYK